MIFNHSVILPYNRNFFLRHLNLLLQFMDLTFHEQIQYSFLSLIAASWWNNSSFPVSLISMPSFDDGAKVQYLCGQMAKMPLHSKSTQVFSFQYVWTSTISGNIMVCCYGQVVCLCQSLCHAETYQHWKSGPYSQEVNTLISQDNFI